MPEPTPRRVAGVLIGLAVLVGLVVLAQRIDLEAWHERAAATPGWLVFTLITALPIVGFPVSPLHVVAGVRFGTGIGLALVAVSIVIQLLVSYGLVQLAPQFFEKHFGRFRKRVPRGAHVPVCIFTMLLPGLPYAAGNYILPLLGVPLRTYLLWCLPLHVVRATVGVLFGDLSHDLTPARITGFVVYTVVILAACGWALHRLKGQLQLGSAPEGEANDRDSDPEPEPAPRAS